MGDVRDVAGMKVLKDSIAKGYAHDVQARTMGKAANAKRKAIFDELEANGKIPPRKKPRIKSRKPEPVPVHPFAWCCRIKYGNTLPVHFRICPDCPLDTEPVEE